MIKAVLFDLDGVLVDGAPWHYAAFNDALIAHGYVELSLDEHKFQFDGLPTARKLARLVEAGRVRIEDCNSIRALKQKQTLKQIEQHCKFDPTIFCTYSGLRAFGIKVGIVTNAVCDTVFEVTKRLNLPFPDVLVTNEECTPKPDPAPYELACRRLMTEPNLVLAVEDGHYGIASAKKAGCRLLEVDGPHEVTPKAIWEAMTRPC